jgi:ADP-ribosylglycohydrolase
MAIHSDHEIRMDRVRLSLDGLSVGDAFGGRFFNAPGGSRTLPPAPWSFSDDTAMAFEVSRMLGELGEIDRERLALRFADRYRADPYRGYGLTVRRVLEAIAEGVPWDSAAREVYGGKGSMGNGGAMRVAPLGAYFSDHLDEVVEQAHASAEVTHAHPEGHAGAIATALAAAWACSSGGCSGQEMLELAWLRTPDSETRDGLNRARSIGFETSIQHAVSQLGNGSRITAPDTIPFALWCAARHIDSYSEALWAVVEAEGDNDTNAAIVGGIVALANGREAIPADWLTAREPLPTR